MNYIFAFDIGTTHTKTAVYDEHGTRTYHEVRNSPQLRLSRQGHVEIDPDEVFRLFAASFSDALNSLNLKSEDSIYVSTSGIAPTFILVDRELKPLTNGILYSDLRFSKTFKALAPYRQEFFEQTGNPLDSQHWLVRLEYFKKMFPDKINKAKYITDILSYVQLRLTGKNMMSLSVAHASGLLDYRTLDFNSLTKEMFGVYFDTIPQIQRYNEYSEARFDFGRRTVKIIIKPPISDAMAAAYSLGAHENSVITLNIGTTATMFYRMDEPRPSRHYFLNVSPFGGYYFAVGSTAAAGGYIDYILNLLQMNHSDLVKLRGKTEILETPYIWGEKSPIFDPDASAAIVKFKGYHTKKDLALASIEAVANSVHHNLVYMNDGGSKIKEIRMSGKAGSYHVLRTALACLTKSRVIYHRELDELYAHYALITGKFNLGKGQITKYDRKLARYYSDKFSKYTKLYRIMEKL